jgi:tripartite-type tricarboxylate transporter receptor subunit TctC
VLFVKKFLFAASSRPQRLSLTGAFPLTYVFQPQDVRFNLSLEGRDMKRTSLAILLLLVCGREAAAQTPYFQGKTIRVVVGYPAGSAHDLWARLIAPQLSKHIPGNPTTVVQVMPGAGSMTATNYIYGVAKPDGLTVGVNNAALYFEQLLKKKEVQFDWSKFTWVGSTTRTSPILYMWANTPYKTIHDVRTATTPPKCGVTGTGNTGYYLPKLLEETLGAKFQLVTGYQGGADIELAVERGEVQCRAFTIQVFFGREPFNTWRSKNLVRVLVYGGKKRDPRLPDTPLLNELMDQYKTADLHRRLVNVMLGSGEFGSAPMFAPPGTPPEATKILRAAYAKGLTSPDLIAEAKKQGLEPELIPGEEMEALAKDVLNQPPEVIGLMKKVMGE